MAAYLFEDTCCGDNLCSLSEMLFLLLCNWRRNLFYYFETCRVIFILIIQTIVLTYILHLSPSL